MRRSFFDLTPIHQAHTSTEIDARLIGEAVEHWKNQPHFQVHMAGPGLLSERDDIRTRVWIGMRARVQSACEKVRLKFPLFGCIWFWWEMDPAGLNLRVRMATKDRDTGVVREFRSDALFSNAALMPAPGVPWDENEVVATLHELVRRHVVAEILEHETDEMLLIDGRRIDPHEGR